LKFLHGCAPTVLILLRVIFAESGVKSKKYASPHLVYLRRLPRGLRGQGAHAYASIDHVDSRARYCRLDYRRRGDSSVLSAWRGRQISSRWSNCFNRWGDFGFVHLAQVQTTTATGITSLIWNQFSRGRDGPPGRQRTFPRRALPIFQGKIDLDQFDSRFGLRSLALSEL
jgi:hypothetical protein